MQDVADMAQVSKATVSKVLNNKSVSSHQLRAKVLDCCEKLGYRLNWNIQDLIRQGKSQRTLNIAFVLTGSSFGFSAYSIFLDGIDDVARSHNFQVVLSKLTGKEKRIFDLPPILRDRRIDGIIVSGLLNEQTIALLTELNIPYVILGNYSSLLTSQSIVVETNIKDAFTNVIALLKENGTGRIAYASLRTGDYYDAFGFDSFKAAMAENGLPFRPELYLERADGTRFTNSSFEGIIGPASALECDAFMTVTFSPALEFSYYLLSEFDSANRPDCTIVTFRVDGTYDLPIPKTIYVTLPLAQMASEAMKILESIVNRKEVYSPRKISFLPQISQQQN